MFIIPAALAVSPFYLTLALSLLCFISHYPSEFRGGLWQVTRVVKPDELRDPDDSLRDEIQKLSLKGKVTTPTVSTMLFTLFVTYANSIY